MSGLLVPQKFCGHRRPVGQCPDCEALIRQAAATLKPATSTQPCSTCGKAVEAGKDYDGRCFGCWREYA